MSQNSDEEEEEGTSEVIIHRARVHGSMVRQEGVGQNTHVVPLGEKRRTVSESERKNSTEWECRQVIVILNVVVQIISPGHSNFETYFRQGTVKSQN